MKNNKEEICETCNNVRKLVHIDEEYDCPDCCDVESADMSGVITDPNDLDR